MLVESASGHVDAGGQRDSATVGAHAMETANRVRLRFMKNKYVVVCWEERKGIHIKDISLHSPVKNTGHSFVALTHLNGTLPIPIMRVCACFSPFLRCPPELCCTGCMKSLTH